jgi:MFS family permease
MATVISFLGFLVAGIVALWLFRTSSSRAVGSILRKPIRSFLVGLLTVIAFPAATLVLAMTLVGLPIAVIGVLIGVIAFIIGPVPAVTALGNRVLVNRGGLFGAFVVGAVLWRLGIWLIPVVGGFIYLIALVWGIGAWVMGFAAARRGDPTPPALLPASLIVEDEIPEDWVPPLAPKQVESTVKEATEVTEVPTQVEPEPQPEQSEAEAASDEDAPPTEDPKPDTDSWGLPTQ